MADPRNATTEDTVSTLSMSDICEELLLRGLPVPDTKMDAVQCLIRDNVYRNKYGYFSVLPEVRAKRAFAAQQARESQTELETLTARLEDVGLCTNQSVPPSLDIAYILASFVEAQKQQAEMNQKLLEKISTPPSVQVHTTADSAKAISLFKGEQLDNAVEWVKEVKRIAALAHWTDSLTLINAQIRLAGCAADWQKTTGKHADTWDDWTKLFLERFKRKLTITEFIEINSQRVLRDDETIVSYIYAKDALLEKSPHPFQLKERVDLIVQGISDDKWAMVLSTHEYKSVGELIDKSAAIDQRRKIKSKEKTEHAVQHVKSTPPALSRQPQSPNHKQQGRQTIHKYNPKFDRPEDQTCFRCREKGHVSYDCPIPADEGVKTKPNEVIKSTPKVPGGKGASVPPMAGSFGTQTKPTQKTTMSANCIVGTGQRPLIAAVVNKNVTIDSLCDPGSDATLIRECFVPADAIIHTWQDPPLAVLGGTHKPVGWATLRIQVGKIDYIMPKVGVCAELPVALILGTDWQVAVQARCTFYADGGLCIATPYVMQEYRCIGARTPSVNCIQQSYRPQTIPDLTSTVTTKESRTYPTGTQTTNSAYTDISKKAQDVHSVSHFEPESTQNPTENICTGSATAREDQQQPTECHDTNENGQNDVITEEEPFLTPEQQTIIDELENEYASIFATEGDEIGQCPLLKARITLKHDEPVQAKPYRMSECDRLAIKEQVDKWLEQGVCRPSTSKYAAPCFMHDQPFHETTPHRLVIDYSKTINPLLIPDPQPLDNMEDVLYRVAGKKYKFKADVSKGFNNIPIHEEDIHKTAFVTPDGHYEFIRMPFGIAIGPATMTRAIKLGYAHLIGIGVSTYIDDITCGSDTFEEHVDKIRKIFEATRKANFKLNRKKCVFAASTISLFGRLLTPDGIVPEPERTRVVERFKPPKSISELRSFLGFINHFREHIQSLSAKAKPLTDLMKGVSKDTRLAKRNIIHLNETQVNAFNLLKELVTSPPVLAYFCQGAPTFVETDASYEGLGAWLSQSQKGKRVVVQYASRTLKDPETRYHSNELECAAVHWAVVDKFRIYLHGHRFKLITDNFTTAYIIAKSRMNRKFARYVVDLAQFEFEVEHRPGKENVVADHLSRHPPPTMGKKQICAYVDRAPTSGVVEAQHKDAYCAQIITKLQTEPTTNHLRQIHRAYVIEEGVLLHCSENGDRHHKTVVVPNTLRKKVLELCHDDAAHLDTAKTLHRVRDGYWWTRVSKDVAQYVRSCNECQLVNRRTVPANGLMGHRPIPHTPWEVISADHVVALPLTKAGNRNMLVLIEHATRYVLARATPTIGASTVITSLEEDIVHRYGPPVIYISDNGPAFTARSTARLFRKYGITHALTPPYTPEANGLVERANGTLVAALKKAVMKYPDTWDTKLPNILLALNTARQSTTHYSPFFLLHGYMPRLPKQLHLGVCINEDERIDQLDLLAQIRGEATANSEIAHEKSKKRFDRGRLDTKFQPNDLVAYDWPRASDHKLSPRFKGPFRILRPIGAVCYIIEEVRNPDNKKIVHVQALKPYHKRVSALPAHEKTNEPETQEDISSSDEDASAEESVDTQAVDVPPEHFTNTSEAVQRIAIRRSWRDRRKPKHFADYELSSD